jgi:hypothetical protein
MNGEIVIPISQSEFGLDRDIKVLGYEHSIGRSIKVFCQCRHYKLGEIYETLALNSFERVLIAQINSGRFVDIDGMTLKRIETEVQIPPIEEGGEPTIEIQVSYIRADNQQAPTQIIDQYTFFHTMITGGSINIVNIITGVVQMEDQINKTFDK